MSYHRINILFAGVILLVNVSGCSSGGCIEQVASPDSLVFPSVAIAAPLNVYNLESNSSMVVISNTTSKALANLSYSITELGDDPSNVTLTDNHLCSSIESGGYCVLTLAIPQQAKSGAVLLNVLQNNLTLPLAQDLIGISNQDNPVSSASVESGINGVDLSYPWYLSASNQGNNRYIVNAKVTSPNFGNFNTIGLLNIYGNQIVTQLTTVSGAGKADLVAGTTAEFLITLPNRNSQMQAFKPLALEMDESKVISNITATNNRVVKLLYDAGVLQVAPLHLMLALNESALVVVRNSGNDRLNNLTLPTASDNYQIIQNSCGDSLAAGAICSFKVQIPSTAVAAGYQLVLHASSDTTTQSYTVSVTVE